MKKGKHVLCEKPIAVNQADAKRMIETARANEVFLMEALWTRFNPCIEAVLNHVKKGDIGKVKYINADFTFMGISRTKDRLLNPKLAGGALLDIGVYPIFLSYLLLGNPIKIISEAMLHSNGVDLHTAMLLKYDHAICNLSCGFTSESQMVAKICGSEGTILIGSRWIDANQFKIIRRVDNEEVIEEKRFEWLGKGYSYEIMECVKSIKAGVFESRLWSHQNSLDLLAITDEVRKQIGLKYPFE